MILYRESIVSAYHNYLVNDMLTPGFLVGDPNSQNGFFFLADLVQPGQTPPRISARLLDKHGECLVELNENNIRENPGGCIQHPVPGGSGVLLPSRIPLLEVNTRRFANGYLTTIKATLLDEKGDPRIEPLGESIQVHGEAELNLGSPLPPSM